MTSALRNLELAIAHGDTAEVGCLLDAEPQLVTATFPDNCGLTPLMWACRSRHATAGTVPIARLLLDRGARIDTQGEHGTTAFFMAVVWMHMELVQFLLERGANPHLPNKEGLTALQAVTQRHDWLRRQKDQDEELKRFGFRAPRMIAFLEKTTQP